MCKTQITSADFTYALKAKKQSFLPHYSPENLITIQILYVMEARSVGWQNPVKTRKRQPAALDEEGLLSQRMPASRSGFKSYLIRTVLLMYHLSAS